MHLRLETQDALEGLGFETGECRVCIGKHTQLCLCHDRVMLSAPIIVLERTYH